MEDTQSSLFRNLCILHLEKLTLELKCPRCLKLLNKPVVFPCYHVFCNGCIAMPKQNIQKCPTCEVECFDQEIRPAPYLESIVRLCQSLEETVNAKAYEHSPEGEFSKQTPSSVNMHCNTRKEGPNKMIQKRIYPTSQLDDSDKSSKGETDARGFSEDVNTIIKKVMPTEGRKVAQGNSKGDSLNSCNGGTDLKKLSPAVCVKVEQIPDCVIIIDDDEDTTIKEKSQTGDCKVGGGNSKSLHTESPVLGNVNVSDKELVHAEKTPAWTTAKKRKTMDFAANTDNIKRSDCAFCHSSEENEGTGPMIGFADNRKIDLSSLSSFARSKAVIVHEKCVNWSPQIFYKNEIIQNLESEVARSAKFKCRSCGKKGASLGCFMKTCRMIYHVPCAYFLPEIRWECDKYLMLCPSHSSCKFPGEKSKPEKCTNGESHPPHKIASEQSDFWDKTPGGKRELVLCGSALSAEDKTQVEKFATTYGVTVSNSWNENITHVIASTDPTGACIRTFEFLMAILKGKWIVETDWIKDSIKASHLLDELDYEIELENHGYRNGPETGRLRISENGPKLFSGLKFYFWGDFAQHELNEVSELVKAGGGTIESRESMMASRVGAAPKSRYVVYNCSPPEGNPVGDISFRHLRLREAVDVACQIGAGVLTHEWILDSIAGCKLVPL